MSASLDVHNKLGPWWVLTSWRSPTAEVRVKVLKVDAAAGKLSLSLKPSATGDGGGGDSDGGDDSGSEASEDLDDAMADRLKEMEGADSDEEV